MNKLILTGVVIVLSIISNASVSIRKRSKNATNGFESFGANAGISIKRGKNGKVHKNANVSVSVSANTRSKNVNLRLSKSKYLK